MGLSMGAFIGYLRMRACVRACVCVCVRVRVCVCVCLYPSTKKASAALSWTYLRVRIKDLVLRASELLNL